MSLNLPPQVEFPTVVPKGVPYYQGELNKLDLQRQEMRQNDQNFQTNQLALGETQRAQQEDMQARALMKTLPPGAKATDLISTWERNGLWGHANKLRGEVTKQEQEAAAAEYNRDRTKSEMLDRERKKLDFHIQLLQSARTPEDAVELLSTSGLEQSQIDALSKLYKGTPPGAWDGTRLGLTRSMLEGSKRMDIDATALRDKVNAVDKKADNDRADKLGLATHLLIPDGKGGMMRNEQLIRAKEEIARKGAPLGAAPDRRPTLTTVRDPKNPDQMLQIDANLYKEGTSLGAPGVYGIAQKEPGVGPQLSQRTIQKREEAYPKATASVAAHERSADELIADLTALKTHKGLGSITGLVAGKIPIGLTKAGRAAIELYENILAKGTFGELGELRASNPTGGALGNVSNADLAILRNAFAALGRSQDRSDMVKNIDKVIKEITRSRQHIRDAYDLDYEYRGQRQPQGSKPPGGGSGLPSDADIDAAIARKINPQQRR